MYCMTVFDDEFLLLLNIAIPLNAYCYYRAFNQYVIKVAIKFSIIRQICIKTNYEVSRNGYYVHKLKIVK